MKKAFFMAMAVKEIEEEAKSPALKL